MSLTTHVSSAILARIQFALNISFHILFPTLTIGMSWILCYWCIRHMNTQTEYTRHFQRWIQIFALSFAFGTVSGVTMSFQFSTNWPGFMLTVGNVAGPLLAYEVMSAFFLEATFLSIMIFAQKMVPRWFYILSTGLVAFGTTLSAFWIISLNAWMHTPSGFHMEQGKAVVDSWSQVIFNPSMPYRFLHTFLGSIVSSAFFMLGLSAWYLLKNPRHQPCFELLKRMTTLAALSIALQIVVGDLHGLNTLKHHPETIAAIEGLWETRDHAPLVLFTLMDMPHQKNYATLAIPSLSSLILTHRMDGVVQGITSFPSTPPILPLFWGFRIMVGIGLLMAILSWWGWYHLKRQAFPSKTYLLCCKWMTFSGWIASLAGWYVTEIGRQPYLVSGLLKTADALGDVSNVALSSSLFSYAMLYIFLLIIYMYSVIYLATHLSTE